MAGADDDVQEASWDAPPQNQRPALRRSTGPNYARSAAFNRSVASSAEPPAPQGKTAESAADPFADSDADFGPAESPLPDGCCRSRNTCCPVPGCGTCNQCGGTAGCCRCCMCGPPGRFWVRDEYLGFWGKGDQLPVLVTTSPTGTLPATTPVFGGNTVNGGYRSGNWIQAGMWLDCCRNWGVQADYFFLGQASTPLQRNFRRQPGPRPSLHRMRRPGCKGSS